MADKITKNTLQLTKEKNELKGIIKQNKLDYEIAVDKITALQTELSMQKELLAKIKRGGMFYYVSNGFVYNINNVEGYFETTFAQAEIDTIPYATILKYMATATYKAYPFVYADNGTFKIDIEEYKKFKGAILL
jgi:hypothetical protein